MCHSFQNPNPISSSRSQQISELEASAKYRSETYISLPRNAIVSTHEMVRFDKLLHFQSNCPDEPILISRCIPIGPLSIVIYFFLGLAVFGFAGLILLHICRKVGITRKIKELYHDDAFEFHRLLGGRADAGTSSIRGGERWVDLEMRANVYSPIPPSIRTMMVPQEEAQTDELLPSSHASTANSIMPTGVRRSRQSSERFGSLTEPSGAWSALKGVSYRGELKDSEQALEKISSSFAECHDDNSSDLDLEKTSNPLKPPERAAPYLPVPVRRPPDVPAGLVTQGSESVNN